MTGKTNKEMFFELWKNDKYVRTGCAIYLVFVIGLTLILTLVLGLKLGLVYSIFLAFGIATYFRQYHAMRIGLAIFFGVMSFVLAVLTIGSIAFLQWLF